MQRWMRSAPVRSDALFASSKASTFYVADYSTFFIFFCRIKDTGKYLPRTHVVTSGAATVCNGAEY